MTASDDASDDDASDDASGDASDDDYGIGGVIDAEELDEKAVDVEAKRIDDVVLQAATIPKLSGKTLSDIFNTGSRKVVQSVRNLLAEFVDNSSGCESTWSRTNKRLQAVDIDYAGTHKEGLQRLCFAVDTSGSVDDATIEKILAVVQDVFHNSDFDTINVCFFHDYVYSEKTYSHGQRFCLPKIIAGGTNFDPVFDHAKPYDALIMLTDGQATIPAKPRRPVAWLLCGNWINKDIPYGRKILI